MKLKRAVSQFLSSQAGMIQATTLAWYSHRFNLLQPLYHKSVGDISTSNLQNIWRQISKRDLSPYTLSGIIVAWRRLFNWLIKRGDLVSNPAKLIPKPRLPDEPPKALERRDLIRLLNASHDHPRDYAIICFLADTGCRVGGLVSMRLTDLDLNRGRAVVREKYNRARVVHMKPRTVQAMRAWLRVRNVNGKRVFSLSDSGIRQMLERTAKRAGVTGRFNPHSFRHGFARGMLAKGADLSTVSQMMGHRDVYVTVKFYARWSDNELHQAHEKFSWLPDEDS